KAQRRVDPEPLQVLDIGQDDSLQLLIADQKFGGKNFPAAVFELISDDSVAGLVQEMCRFPEVGAIIVRCGIDGIFVLLSKYLWRYLIAEGLQKCQFLRRGQAFSSQLLALEEARRPRV